MHVYMVRNVICNIEYVIYNMHFIHLVIYDLKYVYIYTYTHCNM